MEEGTVTQPEVAAPQVEEQTAKVELTPEVAERIEEAAQKVAEKALAAQKAFKFHGGAEKKAELEEVSEKQKAIEFVKAIATGDHATAAAYHNERAAKIGEKAISIAGSAGSDYLVPTVFETDILATFDGYSEIIRDADVRETRMPGHIFDLNELSTRVNVFFADEDASGLTNTYPTYTQPQLAIADLIGTTDITLDFLEDTEADIMGDLSRQFGEAMAKVLQARLINGDVTVSGVVTKGLLNTSGLNQVLLANPTSGYSSITADDIENAYFDAISVDHFQTENQNGTWYMNGVTLQKLRANIRTASTNRDMLSVFDPAMMTLLGRPIVVTNQMPTPTTTVTDPFVVYGNLKNHLKVYRKRGLTMKLNDSGTAKSGRNLNYQLGRELVVTQRIGHQVVLASGLTVICT